LKIESVSQESVTLTWREPLFRGYMQLTDHVIRITEVHAILLFTTTATVTTTTMILKNTKISAGCFAIIQKKAVVWFGQGKESLFVCFSTH
jgi:hypothetical protein